MEGIIGWVKGIIGWLLIMSLMLQCVPGKAYRSYLRLFMGIILILTVLEPFSGGDKMAEELEQILGKLAYEETVPGWKDSSMSDSEWRDKMLQGEQWAENRIASLAEEMAVEGNGE